MDNYELRDFLFSIKDERYSEFSAKLIPGAENMLGIRIPVLRGIAKDIAKTNDYQDFLNSDSIYFEETMLKGMVIGYLKVDIDEIFALCADFIPQISNWSICDSFCTGIKIFKKNQEKALDFIKQYINGTEFEQRFAAVCLMSHFLDDSYIEDVLKIYGSMKNDGYYLKMAVAWGIATAAAKFPKRTMYFIENELDDIQILKYTVKKMKESFRVGTSDKEKAQQILNNKINK